MFTCLKFFNDTIGETYMYIAKKGILPYRQNHAFTMAEVLVTIGIIGVIAAMTLPSIISKHRGKVLEAQLKKNYSMLQQALLEMYRGEGQEISIKNYTRHDFTNKFAYYILNTKKFSAGTITSTEALDGGSSEETIYTLKDYRTYTNKQVNASHLDDGLILFNDGRRIYIDTGTGPLSPNNILLTIDINGVQNKPNRWGFDFFTFEIMRDGRLVPMGGAGTLYYKRDDKFCSASSTNPYNGISCTDKALMEKYYFLNLPTR